jgi:ABC-2 type transport system ATP-binding protein
MPAIVARDLTKRYGRTVAVDGASFEVGRGEIVGFLGPNGAGKTTTLRMLAGLIRPTGGEGRILDERVPRTRAAARGHDDRGAELLPLHDRARQPALRRPPPRRRQPERRIDEVLDFVKLDRASEKRVKAYSQGMRQRLGLARSLLWSPDVLLLDEPTNGLDPVGIAEIRENLRAVAAEGVTVLVSSHILAEIEKLVDRILAIDKGRSCTTARSTRWSDRLDADAVTYHLRAVDGAGLLAALRDLGLEPVPRASRARGDAAARRRRRARRAPGGRRRRGPRGPPPGRRPRGRLPAPGARRREALVNAFWNVVDAEAFKLVRKRRTYVLAGLWWLLLPAWC